MLWQPMSTLSLMKCNERCAIEMRCKHLDAAPEVDENDVDVDVNDNDAQITNTARHSRNQDIQLLAAFGCGRSVQVSHSAAYASYLICEHLQFVQYLEYDYPDENALVSMSRARRILLGHLRRTFCLPDNFVLANKRCQPTVIISLSVAPVVSSSLFMLSCAH
ncbi:hypothetical protein ACLKA7_007432 [Drosophila subpalustris]